jgi:thioredoxin 1
MVVYNVHISEGINFTLVVAVGMSDAEDIEEIRRRKREELATKAESPDEPIEVDDAAHLEELLEEHPVVLVDFYADWCGPCKMLAPTVAEIAAETDATVLKVDIDAHQDLAAEYQVQGVPTLYLFSDGEVEERMVGVQDKGTLAEKVEAAA